MIGSASAFSPSGPSRVLACGAFSSRPKRTFCSAFARSLPRRHRHRSEVCPVHLFNRLRARYGRAIAWSPCKQTATMHTLPLTESRLGHHRKTHVYTLIRGDFWQKTTVARRPGLEGLKLSRWKNNRDRPPMKWPSINNFCKQKPRAQSVDRLPCRHLPSCRQILSTRCSLMKYEPARRSLNDRATLMGRGSARHTLSR